LSVWEAGRGPAVLAIHGLGGSGRYWQGLADLIAADRTLLAPDLGGFGRSGKPDVNYNRSFHLENLDAVVETLAPSQEVVVVGHSVGAVLAALWAARHPERVTALALVAPPFPGLHPIPAPAQWVRDRPSSVGRRLPLIIIRSLLLPVALPWALVRGYPPAVIRDFTRQSLQSRVGTMWALMADHDAARELASLNRLPASVETLLLHSSGDRLATAADVAHWAALLPQARTMVEPGGHQLLLRRGFAELAEWIDNLNSG
jgi:pimeloyl-ACP methyl ester carboxylesterase